MRPGESLQGTETSHSPRQQEHLLTRQGRQSQTRAGSKDQPGHSEAGRSGLRGWCQLRCFPMTVAGTYWPLTALLEAALHALGMLTQLVFTAALGGREHYCHPILQLKNLRL